jgi:serine acetyltransferase
MSIKSNIKNSLKPYNNIVIWGAGGLANTAIKDWLPRENISYVVDKYINKDKVFFNSYHLYDEKKLLEKTPDLIIVCSSAYLEIFDNIKSLGIECEYKYIYELFIPEDNSLNELQKLYIDILATKNCNIFKLILVKPQILVNISFRISKFFKKYKILYPLYLFMFFIHHIFCLLTSIHLPLTVQAGPGLIFAHPGTIIFTGKAKLGSFVTIYHCCTIGTTLSGGNPSIESFVTIYTGSHILGKTLIKKHSKVGALSLLLDFNGEEFSTIVGIPAKTKKKFII